MKTMTKEFKRAIKRYLKVYYSTKWTKNLNKYLSAFPIKKVHNPEQYTWNIKN